MRTNSLQENLNKLRCKLDYDIVTEHAELEGAFKIFLKYLQGNGCCKNISI